MAARSSPASWVAAGQTTLYETAVGPACRVCHQLRGTGRQSDIDFATFEKFKSYANRTFATVTDRGVKNARKASIKGA